MQIIELLTPHYEAAWLPWAVQYFFLVGVATGAALLTSACVFGPSNGLRQRLLPTAVLVLAMSAVAAPVALLADLLARHDPDAMILLDDNREWLRATLGPDAEAFETAVYCLRFDAASQLLARLNLPEAASGAA